MSPRSAVLLVCIALFTVAGCSRVPRNEAGEPLFWYELYMTKDLRPGSPGVNQPFKALFEDMEVVTSPDERTWERLLEELHVSLPTGAQVDRESLPGLRILNTAKGNETLYSAIMEQHDTDWAYSTTPLLRNLSLELGDRRFGLAEYVFPAPIQSNTMEQERLFTTVTVIFGGSLSEGWPNPEIWHTPIFTLYQDGLLYNGPMWIAVVILISILALLFYALRRPLWRILNLRRKPS